MIPMNIHMVCQCADDVNKHGDVQVKPLGRLASINKGLGDIVEHFYITYLILLYYLSNTCLILV